RLLGSRPGAARAGSPPADLPLLANCAGVQTRGGYPGQRVMECSGYCELQEDIAVSAPEPSPAAGSPRPAGRGARQRLLFLVGLAASAVFLYLALRGVDPAQVWRVARSSNVFLLLATVAIGIGTNTLRALR